MKNIKKTARLTPTSFSFALIMLLIISISFFVSCKKNSTKPVQESTQATDVDNPPQSEPDTNNMILAENAETRTRVQATIDLDYDSAANLIKKICENCLDAPSESLIETDSPHKFEVNSGGGIKEDWVLETIQLYQSNNEPRFNNLPDCGSYWHISGLDSDETVLFEMDNGHVAISETSDSIVDYSAKYHYLFTFRNFEKTEAAYWHAHEQLDYAIYPSNRVVRIWIYNQRFNAYYNVWAKEWDN